MAAPTTRERLIEAATTLFYEHGFHAVGLDRILDEVGVTKTTFYNHFESKDDLIVAVLQHRDAMETAQWTAIMRERGGSDPRRQILALFDILEEWFHQEGFRGCMFINAAVEFPAPNDPIHTAAAAHGASLYTVVERLAREAGAEQPELLANQILMLVAGALVGRHVSHDERAAETARVTGELLLDHHLGPVSAGV